MVVFRFRIAAAAVFFTSLSISGVGAEEAVPDTMSQHHQWSQKFDTASDPDVTGSIGPQINASTDTNRQVCVPTGLGFSTPPIVQWRIGTC
jgi:hypothetical protein